MSEIPSAQIQEKKSGKRKFWQDGMGGRVLKMLDIKDKNLEQHKEDDARSKDIIDHWNAKFDSKIDEMYHDGKAPEDLSGKGKMEQALVKGFDDKVEVLAKASIKLQGLTSSIPYLREKREKAFEEATAQYHEACSRLATELGQQYHDSGDPEGSVAEGTVSFTVAVNTHVHDKKLRIMKESIGGRFANFLGKPSNRGKLKKKIKETEDPEEREKLKKEIWLETAKMVGRTALSAVFLAGVGFAAMATGGALVAGAGVATGLAVGLGLKSGAKIAHGYIRSRGRDEYYGKEIKTIGELGQDAVDTRRQRWQSLGGRAIGTALFAGAAMGAGAALRVGADMLSDHLSNVGDATGGVTDSATGADVDTVEIVGPTPVDIGDITSTSGTLNLPSGESLSYTFDPGTHTLNLNGETLTFDDLGQPTGNTQDVLDGLGINLTPKVEHVEAVTESWSPDVQDVTHGEGGFETLQEMGVPAESCDALWRAVQGHLMETGAATSDPNGGLAWLSSPDRDFTPDELQYIANTARNMGIHINTPNIITEHDAVTGFTAEFTGEAVPTMEVSMGNLTLTGAIDQDNKVLHTSLGDLPLEEVGGELQLGDMDISLARYDLNSNDFEPGQTFATARMGSIIDRDVALVQGGAWDGTGETAASANEFDLGVMRQTTHGVQNAAHYNFTGDNTLLGDPGVTVVAGHSHISNGSFETLDDNYVEGARFPVTSGGTTYTYEFVHKATINSTWGDLDGLKNDFADGGSYLMLQTCPDVNQAAVKDFYVARLVEVNSSLDFVDTSNNTVSLPVTIDPVNHVAHHASLGDIPLTSENTLPANFADQINTTVNNMSIDEANDTMNGEAQTTDTPVNDIPRWNIWRDYITDNLNKVSNYAAIAAAAIAAAGIGDAVANRNKAVQESQGPERQESKEQNENAKEREITQNVEGVNKFLTEMRKGNIEGIPKSRVVRLFRPSNNGGMSYMTGLYAKQADIKLTPDGEQLVREFMDSGAYQEGADSNIIGRAFFDWFANGRRASEPEPGSEQGPEGAESGSEVEPAAEPGHEYTEQETAEMISKTDHLRKLVELMDVTEFQGGTDTAMSIEQTEQRLDQYMKNPDTIKLVAAELLQHISHFMVIRRDYPMLDFMTNRLEQLLNENPTG